MTDFSFTMPVAQNQIVEQFNYHGNEIKAITDENGEPWFIAKDVCSALNIVWKGSSTLGPLDDDEKTVIAAETLGGTQEMISINESGIYTLIMRSNKPEARRFRKWVTSEVLPKIRKTGGYSHESVITMPTATKELKACVEMAQIFGLKGNQALLSANTAVKNLHGIDCMATLGITGLISEDKKQYFTPTILGKKIGLSAVKFNKAMEEAGLQTANRDHKKRLIWQVTDAGKPYCELIDTNKRSSDGTPIQQIKWCDDVLGFFQEVAA